MVQNIFGLCRGYIGLVWFLCLASLGGTEESITPPTKRLQNGKTLCLPNDTELPRICYTLHESGRLKAREEYISSTTVAQRIHYFWPSGKPLVFADFAMGTLYHWNELQELQQSLVNSRYVSLPDSPDEIVCHGLSCNVKALNVDSIDTSDWQTGDLIFTGATFPWTGLAKLPISHVSIVITTGPGPVLVLSNDIFEPASKVSLPQILVNAHSLVVLRHERFTTGFKKFLKAYPDLGFPAPHFCANLAAELISKAFPYETVHWSAIDRNYAEAIYRFAMSRFTTIRFHLHGYKSPDEYRLQREPALKDIYQKIKNAIGFRSLYLYSLFADGFPMLPIGLNMEQLEKIQNLIMLYTPEDLLYNPRQ